MCDVSMLFIVCPQSKYYDKCSSAYLVFSHQLSVQSPNWQMLINIQNGNLRFYVNFFPADHVRFDGDWQDHCSFLKEESVARRL